MSDPVGAGAEAYAARAPGHSPAAIRERVWELVSPSLQGAVLDAGAGAGEWAARLRGHPGVARVLAADLVPCGAERRPGVEFHALDLARDRLPIEDGSLDWVFAIEVLEHLANPRHFVREAARCLRPGGQLVITTPSCESLRARVSFLLRGWFPAFCEHDYRESGHITPITSLDLRRMATEAGFRDVGWEHSLPGAIPGLALPWQRLAPGLRGPLWSDVLVAFLTR